jgi:hypothetical protein
LLRLMDRDGWRWPPGTKWSKSTEIENFVSVLNTRSSNESTVFN